MTSELPSKRVVLCPRLPLETTETILSFFMSRIALPLFILRHFLRRNYRDFHRCLSKPEEAQSSLQLEIFGRFRNSKYACIIGKNSIVNWSDIPIIDYSDIDDLITEQIGKKSNFFTSEPVRFYEKTSGSRSVAKLIPYTKSLLSSFNNMFCVWAYDIITNAPKLDRGKLYFCVSPQLAEQARKDTPVGLANDAEYLSPWLRWFLSPFLLSSEGLNRITDPSTFKYELVKRLLLAADLEIISIWNPTFLKVHLDYIQQHREKLYKELKNSLAKERSQLLLSPQIDWIKMWSHLKVISCWDSASAASQANYLRSLFPGVMVQGKGLLATEAPITVPLIEAGGCLPMLSEVFFEFLDETEKIYLLHQLAIGQIYEIILSQKGGLYRYKIGDRVRVTHYYLNTPCLEFIGRSESVSDLVGEKLYEDFVNDCLDNLGLQHSFFQSLLPVSEPRPHYVLILDKVAGDVEAIANKFDLLLQNAYHYRQARLLGQLAPTKIAIVPNIAELVAEKRMKAGQKWGDLKHHIFLSGDICRELIQKIATIS